VVYDVGSMTDDPLEALRRDIDAIDNRLLELLAERVAKVLAVGDVKRERGLVVYDPDRERRVLERLVEAAPAPLRGDMVRRVFERVIDESRRAEQHHVRGDDD
jgi:chorismate mutase